MVLMNVPRTYGIGVGYFWDRDSRKVPDEGLTRRLHELLFRFGYQERGMR